jgi:signal transduction histidine kinase
MQSGYALYGFCLFKSQFSKFQSVKLEVLCKHAAEWLEVWKLGFCRFIDDVEMDVVAAYVPSLDYEFLPTYNCTAAANSCELVIYDPAQRASDKSTVVVAWSYGFQNFELRCYSTRNLWLYALRSIIAWPLLMSILVLLLFVLVYLILKRLESFERDKVYMEKFNADLRAAKLAAEAADKAKSSFLATVSHEIRYIPLHPGMKLPMLL